MANIRVSKRYSKGLYSFAKESNKLDEVYHDMKSVATLVKESKDLSNFLNSPILNQKKKLKISEDIFKSYTETTQQFIFLLIRQNRISLLREIALEYINYADHLKGVQKAIITSAIALDDIILKEILDKSTSINNDKPLEYKNIVDPNLLGGFILRIGDKQIDASLKTKLSNLRNNFDDNLYIPKL